MLDLLWWLERGGGVGLSVHMYVGLIICLFKSKAYILNLKSKIG